MAAENYGKRPMWQWVVIYLIIAAVVYGVVYYIFFANKGGYSMTPYQQPTAEQSTPSTGTTSTTVPSNSVYMLKTDPSKGNYMTDLKGMTLYTYDKDTSGVSNCYGGCAKAWPIYTADPKATLPTDITIVKRTDGTSIYAYKGMPLYYYASDTKAGDITGDGVGGVWHIIKL